MKKMMSTAAVMVALAGTVMFTSCGKSDLYDANLVNEKTVKSYEQQFIEAFGPVSENQSWDFTATAKAATRGDEQPTVTWSQVQHGDGFFQSFANEDFEDVKSLVVSTEAQDWKPYAKMNLHPVFSKGNGGMYNYYNCEGNRIGRGHYEKTILFNHFMHFLNCDGILNGCVCGRNPAGWVRRDSVD